ncbi:MAG: thioredoxin family protein [Chitinophagaceae bacterium]|nr:MAG: thioredoxin family protein [Chitinophagaceae bacterium]
MRFKLILTAVIGLLFLSNGLSAQDSSYINWNSSAVKNGDGKYDIVLKGQLKAGWHLYTKSDAAVGLAGVVINVKDEGVKADTFKFTTSVQTYKDPIFESNQTIDTGYVEISIPVSVSGEVPAFIKLQLLYDVAQKDNFIPEEQNISVKVEGVVPVAAGAAYRIIIPTIQLDNPVNNAGGTDAKSKGLGGIFILGFLGGLVALLTPCVFPMIPLTVSFFTKKSNNRKQGIRNAFIYGFFIFLIYILLSLPFHFIGNVNPEIFNNISTNVYLNIAFFIVFIVFSLSFFGLFEITLPGAVGNSADSKAGVGSIAGIFFMALTLAIVSFSCTGPILGSLLAGSLSSDGGAMQLTSGMAGFGFALALPFALFAMFPNWLNALPKSGGWLTTVKVVLGFLEVALAFKFLSNADLVMHWGILKREVFIAIWIVVFALLTLYLFGIIRFKHDSPIKKLPKVRLILGLLTGAFTLYLVPGVTNTRWNNLSLISGFPPPLYYSIYPQKSDCILGLNCTKDYDQGLKMAKEQNKPMLIDFTGYACVNCRRMEENVWTQPDVYKLLQDKFIIVSLYVDDKKKLPAGEQFTYTTRDGLTKEISSIGDKWATFQTENFKNNSQPWYAVMNTKEQLMTNPVGYVPDARDYLKWLQAGLAAFEASTK